MYTKNIRKDPIAFFMYKKHTQGSYRFFCVNKILNNTHFKTRKKHEKFPFLRHRNNRTPNKL